MSTPPQELRGLAAPMGVAPAGRVLPHDLDAEQAVLGCLLIDADAINQVRDILAPRDFYAERNAAILRAAMALSDRGEPVDILTLKVQLERDGTLARSGGLEYLAELSQKMPTAVSVRHYAQIVVDRSLRRRLIAAGGSSPNSASKRRPAPMRSSTSPSAASSPSATPGAASRSPTSPSS